MALVLFDNRVNMITVATPSSIGAFVIGYDTDGILKQKDHLGVITSIGSGGVGGGIGSLAQTLSIGRTTGTNSIFLDLNTRVESNSGSASLRLDNGIYGNYVQLSSSNLITGSSLTMDDNTIQLTGLSSSVVMSTTDIRLNFGVNQFLLQNNNSYLKLGTTNVLEFTTATTVRTTGSRVPAFISSDGSIFSNAVSNSVIIGGSGIVGTQSNSVYTPNLIIKDGGYVKGTSGDGQLRFNNDNEAYITSGTNIIGILGANGAVMATYNGIFITDNIDTISTTPTSANAIILSSNTTVNDSLTNTVVIGGQNLTVDSSDTVYLGGIVDIDNQYKLPITDGTSGQFIKTDGTGNLSWSSGAGSVIPVITISALDFSNLISYSLSSTYKIVNADTSLYGGTEIYLTTNSEGVLNDFGEGKFYNPRYNRTVSGYDIWGGTSSSYATGSVAYWGGRAWSNNSGTNTFASISMFALNLLEWTLVPVTNGIHYSISYDKIKYDRLANKIIYREERGTNIVSTSTQNILYWEDLIGHSPIKVFQWGNIYNFDTATGIGSQNIINSYNENINFRGSAQNNITMTNLSAQYNLIIGTSDFQENIIFNNYKYNRQSITFTSESGLAFQGDLPQQNPNTLVGKLNNQQVEIDLAATALVTPTIVSRWEIYKSDNTTPFGPIVINGTGTSMINFLVGTFSTSSSLTVPNGCIVRYTGTGSIPAATTGFSTPSTITGSYTFSSGSYPRVSETLSTTGLSTATNYSITLSKPKTGLIVSGSQVIVATGSDSRIVSTSLSFTNVFYYGYLDIGQVSISLTQVDVDTIGFISDIQVQGLGNYKFGSKSQKFASNDGGAGSRLVFAYPSSLGDLSSLTVTPFPEPIPAPIVSSSLNAFIKRTLPLSITTISGSVIDYTVYVAVADNSYGNGTTVTITTL
jgi:hypothetical protein